MDVPYSLVHLSSVSLLEQLGDKFTPNTVVIHKFGNKEAGKISKFEDEPFIRPISTPELPFYGRRDELGKLEESFSNCELQSQYVYITGPPAIGKSELICKFIKSKCNTNFSWIEWENGVFSWYQLYYSLIRHNSRITSTHWTVKTESKRIVSEITREKYWVCIWDNLSRRTRDFEQFLYEFHNFSKIFIVLTSRSSNLLSKYARNMRHINLAVVGRIA